MIHNKLDSTLEKVIPILEENGIDYIIEEDAALFLQEVELEVDSLSLAIQWDRFHELHHFFDAFVCAENKENPLYWAYHIKNLDMPVVIKAFHNEVIQSDYYRVETSHQGWMLWVKHYDYYYLNKKDDDRKIKIRQMLSRVQKNHMQINDRAWNQEAYEAWINRFGTPAEAAKKMKENPYLKLPKILPHLGSLKGKKVINLMGSHGTKAIAMALLGADATVIDLSEENAKYAREVAACAEVELNYIVSDVLSSPQHLQGETFDLLLMELGVMHYFIDLHPLAKVIYGLLNKGGKFLLHEFHPISTKLVSSKGKKHKADGNYFDRTLHHKSVAFSKHLNQNSLENAVIQRYWTLGEMITVFAQEGLAIKQLDEFPNMKKADSGLPKTFLLICEK